MRVLALLTTGCAVALLTSVMAAQAPSTSPRKSDPPPDSVPQLRLVGTIKDIMLGIIDPAADDIWGTVWTEDSAQGIIEHQPKTEEEWAVVEHDALVLAEAANLLKMPGRAIARPEELHVKSTADPAELTPAQIADRIAGSQATFLRFADMLQEAAVQGIKVARAKDVQGTFDAGRQIYIACVACHQVYWYPGSGQPSQKSDPSPRK